ncbi:tetratricopeptide repeat protein [Thermodesulforhabdus norvegica]|uniref:Tetratricopeptide repeat-containing protein n=1 Tax=Thermodesulforhabdus norvegica TaxID=39841 RepID=A0A1I4VR03_9BACT|nr:tetratricopeptide repeat protein [Thermodesulforhabdus norvegica]SFN03406.1 Tetratricopeptide repeat-containing protein [Thermodesulforhabdus norvegica]
MRSLQAAVALALGCFICTMMVVDRAYGVSKAYHLYEQAQTVPFTFNKIALYDQAIAMDSEFTEARKARAFFLFYQGKYRQAIDDLNICIEKGKATAQDHYLRARAYFGLEDYGRAVRDFDFVLKQDPSNREALLYRARTYYMLGDYGKAMEDLTKIFAEGVHDYLTGRAYRLAGFIMNEQGRTELAEEYFQRASQFADPWIWGAYLRVYDPGKMSVLGMIGIIVGCLALIFRLELPPPRKKKRD